MAISGTWSARYANAQNYTGALRWGTGVNPIHSVRDNPGRVTGIKENLYPLGDASDAPPDSVIGPDDYVDSDWDGEQPYPDEDFRYQDTEPRWGTQTESFRGATLDNPVMGEWTEWGPYYPEDADFPLGGPTGGMAAELDVSHGEDRERQHAIAVPTQPVAGGWLNKARSAAALAKDNTAQAVGDPATQWAVNTGQVQGQGVKYLDNSRAVARGTDAPRESILSRVAAMRVYSPAQSFQMGGSAGAPDMYPFQQTAGLKRPFVARQPGLPPFEEHTWNEMEGRVPLQRTVPPDPYQGDPETAGTTDGTDAIYDMGGDWGY
jgi:hypothetical protein